MPKRGSTAFTLVEMLVVVAIIGLLIAILLPALARTGSKAKTAICLANLNQIMQANIAFASSNDGYSVRTLEPNANAPSGGMWWTSSLFDYQHPGKLVFCPEAINTPTPTMGTLNIGARHESWWDGVQYPHSSTETERGSYGQNMFVSRFRGSMTNWGFPQSHHWSGRLSGEFASEIPLFLDAIWTGGYAYNTDTPGATEGYMSGQTNRFALRRHEGKVNLVLLDGSARTSELSELWLLRWNKISVPVDGVVIPWD